MPTEAEVMKTIAENLPSPYSMDIVWRQTTPAVFDLSLADPDSAEDWRKMARAVIALFI